MRHYTVTLIQHDHLHHVDIVREQTIEADTVSFPSSGGLCFYVGTRLVSAVAPGTWQNAKDVTDDSMEQDAGS